MSRRYLNVWSLSRPSMDTLRGQQLDLQQFSDLSPSSHRMNNLKEWSIIQPSKVNQNLNVYVVCGYTIQTLRLRIKYFLRKFLCKCNSIWIVISSRLKDYNMINSKMWKDFFPILYYQCLFFHLLQYFVILSLDCLLHLFSNRCLRIFQFGGISTLSKKITMNNILLTIVQLDKVLISFTNLGLIWRLLYIINLNLKKSSHHYFHQSHLCHH